MKRSFIVLVSILDVFLLSVFPLQLVFEGVCNKGPDCDIGITQIEILPTECPDTWQKGKCKNNPRKVEEIGSPNRETVTK